MPKRRQQRQHQGLSDYERFQRYLHVMHNIALNLLDGLPEEEKRQVRAFFDTYYPVSEHYWSVKKLYAHAMYIPMFLQIGRRYFDRLVYIDTHSGPGLAKIGSHERDIVLGSPLIALHWPRIVAERVKQFKGIANGFNELHFIDLSPHNTMTLRRFVKDSQSARVYTDDANNILPRIPVSRKSLVYLFVDPYGALDSQLKYSAMRSFVEKRRVDIMVSVFAPQIAQGLAGIADKGVLERRVDELFGPNICSGACGGYVASLCEVGGARRDAVLEAFKCMLRSLGYKRFASIPVEFNKGILYYMLLATKGGSEDGSDWISGYVEYMNKYAPKDYEALRRLWLRTTDRQTGLFDYLGNASRCCGGEIRLPGSWLSRGVP